MEYMHHLRGLPESATSLLIECRGETKEMLMVMPPPFAVELTHQSKPHRLP